MQRYPILHSGFIARIDTHLTKTEYARNPFVENVLFRKHGNNDYANLFFSKEVDELYKEFQANRSNLRDFEFRERILKIATLMFGKTGITDWVDIQNKYAKVPHTHLEFIIDIARFIISGKRQMSMAVWENFITHNSTGPFTSIDKSEELRVLIKDNKAIFNGHMSIVLNEWVSQVGGYEDLLYTLWLIFGTKQYANHVAVQSNGV